MEKIDQIQSIKLKQKQSLHLSNKMKMSLKVMQLSISELRQEIFDALETNVALELIKDPSEKHIIKKDKIRHSHISTANEFIENIPSEHASLQSLLLSQLVLIKEDRRVLKLSRLIIQNLDNKGFCIVPIKDLFDSNKNKGSILGQTTLKKARTKAIKIVQSLEPLGCATKDIKDYLCFQLYLLYKHTKKNDVDKKKIYSLARRIVQKYFLLLKKDSASVIQKALKKDKLNFRILIIKDAINLIKSLKPYPSYLCNNEVTKVQYIIPDVFIELDDNNLIISTNKHILPIVSIAKNIELLSNKNKEASSFAKAQIDDAQNLILSIKMRENTLIRVVKAITVFQQDFFYYGIAYLSPLRQKDIADELNISNSTVSRIANNKYVSCKWGIFPVSYFFTQKVTNNNVAKLLSPKENYVASGISTQACKEMIRSIASSHKNISDREIADMLSKKGVNISRRTVAKYRNEIGIKSSHKRT